MWGATVYAYGTPEIKAAMTVNSEKTGNRIFKASAEQLIIKKGESILGDHIESTIYLDNDSLSHPSSDMRFDITKNNLSLVKGASGSDQNPFYDSYHRVNFFQAVRFYCSHAQYARGCHAARQRSCPGTARSAW